jgi:hypothetical protein
MKGPGNPAKSHVKSQWQQMNTIPSIFTLTINPPALNPPHVTGLSNFASPCQSRQTSSGELASVMTGGTGDIVDVPIVSWKVFLCLPIST